MTTTTESTYLLEVKGDKPRQIHEDLDVAVGQAIAQALKIGCHGVLVTQHSYTLYSVTLNEEVPYGQIHERRLTT